MGGKVYQTLTTLASSFGSLVMGLLNVWPSYTAPLLTAENTTLLYVPMSPTEESLLGSLPSLGAMLGTALVGPIIETFGRKLGGVAIQLPFVLSWSIVGVTKSMTVILVARFIGGISGGANLVYGPMFVSEIAEDSIRGTLASAIVISYGAGTLASYLLGWFFSYHTIVWINLTSSVLCCVTLMCVAESPVFLLKKKRDEEAKKALAIYRGATPGSAVVQNELARIKQQLSPAYEMVSVNGDCEKEVDNEKEKVDAGNLNHEPPVKKSVFKTLFMTPSSRRGFLVVLTVMSMQVMMGMVPVQVFAKQVFREADPSQADLYSVIFAVVLVAGGVVTGGIADRAGRRLLIIASSVMVAVCMAILGYLMLSRAAPAWATVLLILMFCFCFMCGAGSIPYVLLSEMFVPEVQAVASSIIIEWVWFLNFVILVVFNWLLGMVGIHGAFFIFALNSLINAGCSWWLVPETKGLSNYEIQEVLAKNRRK